MILAGLAAIAGLFALVVLFNEGLSLAGCTAAAPLGWTVPLVSVVVIGVAAWLLLSQSEKHPGSAEEFRSTVCPSCGGNVLSEWRLCPYCGANVPPLAKGPDAQQGQDQTVVRG